jgi:hypothetical protein
MFRGLAEERFVAYRRRRPEASLKNALIKVNAIYSVY